MKCEFCDLDATVHLKQILENETKELHLCEKCAEERGITDPDGFSLADLLGDKPEQSNEMNYKDAPTCSVCGFSLEDLKKVGRLGCPQCYEAFRPEVVGMLATMHRDVKHVGKRPEGLFELKKKQEDLKTARKELQKAIDEEDFELAAKLRDSIKELEKEMEADA